jgi:transposase InsO family protein
MNSITQDIRYKQSVIKYSYKYGVTKAAVEYKMHRKTIYRWREKYDGTLKSLINKSRRPRSHPKQHTEEEIKLIKNMKAKNKETGLVILWVKLRRRGYTRRVESLYRVMVRCGIYERVTSKKKKYIAKEYEQMKYPGERVQIDVKYVPRECMTKELIEKEEKYYQYTAIDEYTRIRYISFSKEHNTYESSKFAEKVKKVFPFKIKCIQTDNGFEFTNRLNSHNKGKKTMFEAKLEEMGIKHKLIKPWTPRHNGKVERSHRKDQERFYYKKIFYSIEDLRNRAKYYIKEYNNFPMKPLNWLSPREKLREFEVQESG